MNNQRRSRPCERLGVLFVIGLVSCAWGPPGALAKGAKPSKSGDGPLDLVKKYKDQYAQREKPVLIDIHEARYLTLAGKGAPEGGEFQEKVGAMYGMAWGLKMKNKFAGRDYVVPPLEGLWWASTDQHSFVSAPRETWQWKLLMRVPSFITEKEVLAAASGGKTAEAKGIRLEVIAEGRCVQVLHLGPYSEEPKTIAVMRKFAERKKLVPNGHHHEIYLTDPNRTPPEKMRTILRQPVKEK